MAKKIPEGYHTITPHLIVNGAEDAIEFYKRAFGAEVRGIHYGPGKAVMHAEIKIGDSIVMLNDEFPDYGSVGPKTRGGTSTVLDIYTEDADAIFNRATSAGATVIMPLADQFWGDRYGQVEDPYGHRWSIATHQRDMSAEEIQKAMKKAMPDFGG